MQSNGGADQPNPNPAQPQPQPHQLPPPRPAPSPQHWMPAPMPYPAAATLLMQHQMMAAAAGAPPPPPQFAPPHYVQYHQAQQQYHQLGQQQHQQQGGRAPPASSEDNKTVWVGDLAYWMDENYLHNCFVHTGEVVSIKVIRNKQTGQSEGYGFVEFFSHAAAERVLQNFNGMPMPNTEMVFRLNWASFSMGERRSDTVSDLSIFVGDLASDVTDALLQETFASRYPSVKGAKVVIDANTGRSKGYGFVRFGDENEKSRALSEMNGVYCSSRAMRVGAATPRKSAGFASNAGHGSQGDGDLSNTTVFVGGLDPNASEDDLRQAFSEYGEIASIKIPFGKQCGFVQFVNRNNAEEALQKLNGTTIGKQTVRLSWGRNPANKQARMDGNNQWNGSPYYGGQVYEGYGYPAAPHGPGMYPSPYGPYSMYGSQQQVS